MTSAVHQRYVELAGGSIALAAHLIGEQESRAYLADLVGETGAADRREHAKDHPIAALLNAIFESHRSIEALENVGVFARSIMSIETISFPDKCDAVRHLHWSMLYSCRERHVKLANILPSAGRFQPQLAKWTSRQCARFVSDTQALVADRGRAAHERDHHDPFEQQWKMMSTVRSVVRLQESAEVDADALARMDEGILGYAQDLTADLFEAMEAQNEALRSETSKFLEKIEPLVRSVLEALGDQLSKQAS